MPIIDPISLYLKMQGDPEEHDNTISSIHDSEVREMNAERRAKQKEWMREHNH